MKPRIASITGLLTLIGALAIVVVAFWAWSASGEREARPSDNGVVSNDSDSRASDTGTASASKGNGLSADRAVLVLPLSESGVDRGGLSQVQHYLASFGHSFTPGKLGKYSSCDLYVDLCESEVVDFIYEMRNEMPAFSGAGDRGLQRLLRCVRFAPDPTSGKYPQWLASEGAESYVRRIWHDKRERPEFDVETKHRACHESGPEQVLLELAWEGDNFHYIMMAALKMAVKALRLPYSSRNKTDIVRLTEGQLELMVEYLAPGLREEGRGVEDVLSYARFAKGSNQASWPEWSEGGQVGFVVRRMWASALSNPGLARQDQGEGRDECSFDECLLKINNTPAAPDLAEARRQLLSTLRAVGLVHRKSSIGTDFGGLTQESFDQLIALARTKNAIGPGEAGLEAISAIIWFQPEPPCVLEAGGIFAYMKSRQPVEFDADAASHRARALAGTFYFSIRLDLDESARRRLERCASSEGLEITWDALNKVERYRVLTESEFLRVFAAAGKLPPFAGNREARALVANLVEFSYERDWIEAHGGFSGWLEHHFAEDLSERR